MRSASTNATEENVEVVVIGGSAGAIEALGVILPKLPASFRLPVIVVVHLPPNSASLLVDAFGHCCAAAVCEVESNAPLVAGKIFFAPPDYHVLIELDRSLSLFLEQAVRWSRPSIDVLFHSAADALGAKAIGVLLTGANDDGAGGLRAMKDAGGVTVVQDPKQAQMSKMPDSALRAAAATHVLRLDDIANRLLQLGGAP